MAEIRHRVGIRGSPSAIYADLIQPGQLKAWWASHATGSPIIGNELVLEFAGFAQLTFKVVELVSDDRVAFECVSGPGPWVGSKLAFVLEPADDQVFLTLTHSNIDPADPSYLYFNTKWPVYLLSLKSLIETGKGTPYPTEPKIHDGD
jgi:uncharacterized protein YndB with AHSA1/START domain